MAMKCDTRSVVLTLEKHFELFEKSMDCNEILGTLRMEGVISRLEMQQLQAERTQIERNRNCLDTILRKVKTVPNYFETFCTVLKTDPHFAAFLESMIVSFAVYSSETEIREFINIKSLLVHISEYLNCDEKVALDSNTGGEVLRQGDNRVEYFIKLLTNKDSRFIKLFMKCLAADNKEPNHVKLHQLLQQIIEQFNTKLGDSLVSHKSVSASIIEYKDYLKQLYLRNSKLVAEDNFEGTNIDHFVNLTLIIPDGDEHKYFKAITDPYSLLFKRDYYKSKTVPLKSLQEIFDASTTGRQVTLIQGSPGSGKTTLANEICRQWARGMLIQNFTLVIIFKLRDHRIVNFNTIDEFIYCTTGHASFACEALQDMHCYHGKNILLLLEGWDERHDDQQHNLFLTNMVSGKLLKDASVLITSRPSAIGTIQKSVVTRNIAILGFAEDQIRQYVQQCLEDNLSSKFLNELYSHEALKSLACVPVNLSILIHVFKQSGEKLPNSWTKLYQQYVLYKLSHYNSKMTGTIEVLVDLNNIPSYIEGSLDALRKVAYSELLCDKFTFTEDKMRQYYGKTIEMDYDGMGLLQVENLLLHRKCYRTFSFLHRTVQEFVAAWQLTSLKPDEQCRVIIEILQNNSINSEMLVVFYAGLTQLRIINFKTILSAIIERINPRVFNASRGIMNLFYKGAIMTTYVAAMIHASDYHDKFVGDAYSIEMLIVLITCCAEAKNPTACRILCTSSIFYSGGCYIKVPHSALASHVMYSLSYCIAHSGKQWHVECPTLKIDDIECLRKSCDASKISVDLTWLHTQVGRRQIDCFITLIQSQCCIRILNLNGSDHFDDYCVAVLSNALLHTEHLTHLGLNNCTVSSNGLLTIAQMLQTNNVLKAITLEENTFSRDAIKIALQEMTTNTMLRVMAVDQSLVDSDLRMMLSKFNKNRKISLTFDPYAAAFRFSNLFK